MYYAGNLARACALLAGYPVNTDDRPQIQFSAARSQRAAAAGRRQWFVGDPLIAFFRDVLAESPVADDPLLARLTPRQREAVPAGLDLFEARLASARDDEAAVRALLARAGERLAADARDQADRTALRRELEALRGERDAAIEALQQRIERRQRD